MTRGGTVYMMTSLNNNALYTGVTSDLVARVQEHKNKIHDFSFTSKLQLRKAGLLQFFLNN
jgi:putative endonuclease